MRIDGNRIDASPGLAASITPKAGNPTDDAAVGFGDHGDESRVSNDTPNLMDFKALSGKVKASQFQRDDGLYIKPTGWTKRDGGMTWFFLVHAKRYHGN